MSKHVTALDYMAY